MNILKLFIALCLLASITGCRKNVDTIEETTEDITPFMRITLNGETTEHEPFAAECQGDVFHKLGVSNTTLLLQNSFDWAALETGDFLFEITTYDVEPSFGFTYKLEGNNLIGIMQQSDLFYEEDGEIFSGDISGSLFDINTNEIEGTFSLEFRSLLSYDQNYCE